MENQVIKIKNLQASSRPSPVGGALYFHDRARQVNSAKINSTYIYDMKK